MNRHILKKSMICQGEKCPEQLIKQDRTYDQPNQAYLIRHKCKKKKKITQVRKDPGDGM